MTECTARICLGTVKLGVPDYGFSSRPVAGEFDPRFFLAQVEAAGVHCFDTSPRYGRSEEILGSYLARSSGRAFVSSKIDALRPDDPGSPEKMLSSVRASLQRLNLPYLDVCYLHQNELEIIADPYVHEGLRQLKELGLIGAAGASLYSHAECDYALGSGVFDVIQVPVSIFDLSFYQRFISNNKSGVRFAARSLLLQGILADRAGIDSRIRQAREVQDYLHQLDRLAKRNGLSVIALALGFVSSLPGIDQYLLGTTSVENLRQNIRFMNRPMPQKLSGELVALAEQAKNWTNPRNWGG
jgi:aryl-alcohol dehydrogenase-like predicted oxidoreductase